MDRLQAYDLLQKKISNQNMIKHSLAVEECLKELARHFKEDEEKWGIAGLLHDYDYAELVNSPEKHGLVAAEELEKLGLDKEITQAIKAHNEQNGTERISRLDKAIHCVDPLTGLIVAAALILPSKKINELTMESVLNRFEEKRFAAGANREIIKRCSEIGLTLAEFTEICLKAMQKISQELGL